MFSGCGVPAFLSWFSTIFLKIVIEVINSGLPQVCKLWFGIGKGLLPVRHLTEKSSWLSIIVGIKYPADWGGRHLPTIIRKVQPHILEHASLACCMTGSLMGALGVG